MARSPNFGRRPVAEGAWPGPATDEPAGARGQLPIGMLGLGAAGALIGFAVVLWIAANWQQIGKIEKFALVGGATLAAAVLGSVFVRLRAAMALLGLLAIGGLYALYGQIYQVSSDAYVLFAMWAATGLAWVIAARSDAAWALWVVIASTAIGLWSAFGGGVAQALSDGTVYAAWAMALGIVLLLSPWAGLEAYIGRTWWSYRLASVLALSLVAGETIAAIVMPPEGFTELAGALILFGVFALYSSARPFSVSLLALSALAIDGVLMTWVTYSMGRDLMHASGFLMLGLIYAGIVAVSAMIVMHIAKERGAEGFGGGVSRFGFGSHWAVALLSGIGALLSFLPFLIFLGLAFGATVFQGGTTYVVGGVLAAGSVFVLQGSAAMSFRQQAGFIGLIIGGGLVTFALFRDLPLEAACFVVFWVCAGLALIAPSRWIVGVLGAAAGAAVSWMAAGLIAGLTGPGLGSASAGLGGAGLRFLYAAQAQNWGLLLSAVAAAAGLVALAAIRQTARDDEEIMERGEGFLVGWCGLALAAQVVGNPTFLLTGGPQALAGRLLQGVALDLSLTPMKVVAVGVVAGAFLLVYSRDAAWRSGSAIALAAVVAVLTYVMNPIAVAVAVFCGAYVAGRRGLMLLAAAAIVWLVGSFYYWLGLPLMTKAYLLGGLGVVLGALTLMSDRASDMKLATGFEADRAPAPMWIALVLAVLSAGSAFAAVGVGVSEKEDVLANGRRVFVKLAPVDPRSRIRGDFMRLNFEAPRLGRKANKGEAEPVWAVGDIDPDGVFTIRSFAPANVLEVSGDLLVKVRFRNRRMVLGTDAFFFEEGQRAKYSAARYGEFRVGPNGDVILVGLADKDRKRIE